MLVDSPIDATSSMARRASEQAQVKSTPLRRRARGYQAGFTLVEMAVVLVVIGVILAAVMIGRDVQRNTENLKIRQTFVNQWSVVYNSYLQKMGGPLGDNVSRPTLMVNGANYTGAIGGDMTAATPPPALCAGAPDALMARQNTTNNLRSMILEAGIELPTGRGVGAEDRYVYQDTNGNPQELQVCFQWNPPGTRSGAGNVMVISGLTPDLARSLAVGLKGNSDANTGVFRMEGIQGNGSAAESLEWTAGKSRITNMDGAGGGGGEDAPDKEQQVTTLVAHLKMNH